MTAAGPEPNFAETFAPCMDVVGHEQAEQNILQAWHAQKFHHAWLLQGPSGIGKRSFAWRVARFLASQSADAGFDSNPLFAQEAQPISTLNIAKDHPVQRQILAGSAPTIRLLQRQMNDKGSLQATIDVTQVRTLNSFLNATVADGGWRVIIIDAADELNRAASNALLKMLEEPPSMSVFLLVAHVPGRVMPTLRSRCRRLTMRPVNDQAMQHILQHLQIPKEDWAALTKLAAGRPGRALRYHQAQALELLPALEHALSNTLHASERIGLISGLLGKQNQQRLEVFVELAAETMMKYWYHQLKGDVRPEAWQVHQGYQLLDEVRNLAGQAISLHLEVRMLVGRLLDIAEQLGQILKAQTQN